MSIKNYQAFLEGIFGFGKKSVSYYYSQRFRDVLQSLADSRDEVAQQLLWAEDSNQVEDDITLVDITENEDMVSFIQVNRLKRFQDTDTEFEIKDIQDYVRSVWRYTDSNLNHRGWKEQRTEISIGRFCQRVFQKAKATPPVPAKIEKFVNSYKTRIKVLNDVESLLEFVTGDDIRKWYLEDNYHSNRGQLSNSCMRYKRCQDYFDIYTKNPEVCQLLILKAENDKIAGRALVWKLKDGKTYMDRQYCNYDSDMQIYEEFAKKKGWLYHGMGGITQELQVQLNPIEIKEFPYMDTFISYNHEKHILSNDEDLYGNSGWWKLTHTSGGYDADNMVWSEYLDEYINSNDAVFCVDVNDYLPVDQAVYIESQDRWYTSDSEDICWSEYDETYYHIDDAVFSFYLEDWLSSDDSIIVYYNSYDETAIPKDMDYLVKTVEINGEEKDCLILSIMVDPFTDEFCFKNDRIKLVYSPDLNSYVTEEEAKSKNLEIDRTKSVRTISKAEFIANKIKDVNPGDLFNYLVELKPTKEVLEKINEYYRNTPNMYYQLKDESTYTNLEKFQIIKAGIWFGYDGKDKTSTFSISDNTRISQTFMRQNESNFLKFMNEETYSKLYSGGYWRTFLKDAELFLYDIIDDSEMLKIYYSLKYQ